MTSHMFDVTSVGGDWLIGSGGPSGSIRRRPSPLADDAFLRDVISLQEHLSTAVLADAEHQRAFDRRAGAVARRVGGLLASLLFSDLVDRPVPSQPAWVHIRSSATNVGSDDVEAVLSLPWELLFDEAAFPVATGLWTVTREIVLPGTTPAERSALTILLHVSAPVDRPDLGYEEELSRVLKALQRSGQRFVATELGTSDESLSAIRVARVLVAINAVALRFNDLRSIQERTLGRIVVTLSSFGGVLAGRPRQGSEACDTRVCLAVDDRR